MSHLSVVFMLDFLGMEHTMKKTLVALGLAAMVSAPAFASNMYINLPNNSYDMTFAPFLSTGDADTRTASFNEFGFNQLLATSVYDLSDGNVLGSFYDTNKASELAALGIGPVTGLAMDGVTTQTFSLPVPGQVNIGSLKPLAPPLGGDNEGFLTTWNLSVSYHFDGTLTSAGPVYTGGTFEMFFQDVFFPANNRKVLGGTLLSSELQAANLNLFFDITYAATDFLFIQQGSNWIDASTLTSVVAPELVLDTNVNPPIPTLDQLLQLADGNNGGAPAAVRQTTLDGSITPIPEPGTIALLGLGLVGLSLGRRRFF